jgi:hypothetical protein
MLRFKEYLEEGKLSIANLEKRKDGVKRGDIVHDWIKSNKPVKIDGNDVLLTYIDPSFEIKFAGGDYSVFKSGSRYQPIWKDSKGKFYDLNDLDKTAEFGGGSGSGGGAANTSHTESAQCVYAQAYWDNKNTKFTPEDLTSSYSKVDVTAKLKDILNISDEWKMSCITGARILSQSVKGKSMNFHRGSSWVKSLETKWKQLNKKADSPFTDVNKWNPADIWLIGSQTKADEFLGDKAESLESLNALIKEAFKNKEVYGVSLKLMLGATHISTVNYRPNQDIPKYESKTIGKVNLYNSKDVYLKYAGGEIQFRGFGGRVDSWQGELGGAHSKLGKIGRGSINTVLKKLAFRETIPDEATLLKSITDNPVNFIEKTFWPLLQKIQKDSEITTIARNLKSFKEDLKKYKKDNDIKWMKSKYLGLYLFDIIKGKENEATQGFITYASSNSELSSTHLKLM